MHRQPIAVEVKKSRGKIENHLAPSGLILRAGKAVGPRMQERDPGGASLGGRDREVLDPSQELFTSMSQGRAEHASSGQKDRVQIACRKPQRGRIA